MVLLKPRETNGFKAQGGQALGHGPAGESLQFAPSVITRRIGFKQGCRRRGGVKIELGDAILKFVERREYAGFGDVPAGDVPTPRYAFEMCSTAPAIELTRTHGAYA